MLFLFLLTGQIKTNSVDNLIRPFSGVVWLLVLMSLMSVTVVLLAIHDAYNDFGGGHGLVRENVRRVDLLFKTLGTLTEPDRITFFPKLGAGKTTPLKFILQNTIFHKYYLPFNQAFL